MTRTGTAVLAALALLVGPARADVISVNFTGNHPGIVLGPTAQPGIVPASNWNNMMGNTATGVSLVNSLGAATGALLSYDAAGAFPFFHQPATPNAMLYGGGLFGDSANREVSITVNNIPYAAYDLYVYASADSTSPNTLSITDGNTTYYYSSGGTDNTGAGLLRTTSTDPLNPTVGPGQYQLFGGLPGRSFTLTTDGSLNAVLGNNVFGFQIVSRPADVDAVHHPEPATLAVFAGLVGVGGLVARRRNRS